MLCNCDRPQTPYSIVDITNNKIIYRCATTVIQYQDLKQSKIGGWPLIRSKDGKPCNFYKEKVLLSPDKGVSKESSLKPLIEPLKISNVSVPFQNIIEKVYNKAVLAGKYPEELRLENQHYEIGPYEDDSSRSKKGVLDWKIIGALDYYAINFLLIKPWIRCGDQKESWSAYLERFKSTPWIDKSSVLSKKKLDNWLKIKKKRAAGIEKSVEIFDMLPGLQKKIRRQFKKDLKKEEKIIPQDIQEQSYFQLFNNKKDLAAYQTKNESYDTDLEDIEEADDQSIKSERDTESVTSSQEENDEERSEYGEDYDEEEPNERAEDYDIGIFD